MKKVKILLACLILATSSWAATTIYPTADRLCRNGSSTTWTAVGGTQTPADPSESFTTFELKYKSRLYAIMQFEVPNFKAVKTMSFIFTKDNAATLMGVWNYSGYNMPENNGTSATYTYQKVTEVVGVEPGETTKDSEVIEPLAKGDSKDGVWTFAIDANTIAPTVVYKEDGTTAVVQLLLTTYAPSRDAASKIFAYNEDLTKTPHLDVEYVDYSKPVQEICYRTKSGNTGWNNSSYPMHAAASANFEIACKSSMCVVYQYWLEDFDNSMNYTFKITKTNQEADVYAWEFPYDLPQKNSDPATDFATNVETVTGVALGTAAGSGTYNEDYIAKAGRKDGIATFTIKGSDLKNMTIDARGNRIVTLLLMSDLGGNYKLYNSLSDIEDAKKPSWNVSYINVYNETQDLCYSDLKTAITEAVAEDVIRINNNLSVDARHDIDKNITIYGRTQETKITGTKKDKGILLARANVTLKNLTVDGNGLERNIQAIECASSTLTLENIICQNATYSANADVKVNNTVVLTGNNVFTTGLSLNKGKRVQTTNATHTEPIQLILAKDYAEDYAVVLTCTNPDLFTAKDANGNDWYLYVSNNELKGKKYLSAITLDEAAEDNESTLALYNGRTVDITLARTFAGSASEYSTICLPFETTKDELGAAEVYVYSNATFDGDDVATLYFVPATDLEAGKPYLVRFAEDKENPVFEDKTITAATPGKYGDSNYEFAGLFSQTKITETEDKSLMYLGSSNTLYWAGENCTIKGSRGYFKAVSAPAKAARRVAIGHQAPTDIETHDAQCTMHNGKFLINGQFVIMKDNKKFNAQGQIIK